MVPVVTAPQARVQAHRKLKNSTLTHTHWGSGDSSTLLDVDYVTVWAA